MRRLPARRSSRSEASDAGRGAGGSAFDRAANERTMLRLINHAARAGLAAVTVASRSTARPLRTRAHARARLLLPLVAAARRSASRARGAGYSTSGCSSWASAR